MKSHELRLVSMLLEMASQEFSNHGCNDFKWPDWFPESERVILVRDMAVENRSHAAEVEDMVEDYSKSEYAPPDWWLMTYLSKLAKVESGIATEEE